MIASAEYVKSILEKEGLCPNKNLGQNFFIDGERLRSLLELVPLGGRTVLEIGPGLGALTELLLERAEKVFAIEKDPRMAALTEAALGCDRLTVIRGDCLKADCSFLPEDFFAAGNLPYCITSDILERLVTLLPAGMAVMVQKEAGERFFSRPGDKSWGPLPAVTALFYEVRCLGELGEGCYLPPPHVKSAMLYFIRKETVPEETPAELLRFFSECFRMRRKTLVNNLSGYSGVRDTLSSLGLPPAVRGEALEPGELLQLYRAVKRG